MEAAIPTQYVATGARRWFIVSKIASPAYTLPPGDDLEIHYHDQNRGKGAALRTGFAKAGGELFERLGMPAVLGELVVGIVLGNCIYKQKDTAQ